MSPKRLALGARFALFFAMTLATTALTIYLLLSFLAVRQSESQAGQAVHLATQVMSRLVKTQADALRAQCQFTIERTGLGQLVTVTDHNTINEVLHEQLSSLRVDSAVLVNGQGHVLGGTQDSLVDVVERARLDSGEPWSGIVVAQGQPQLVVITPIRDPASKELQGALLVYRRIDDRLAGELAEALGARITFTLGGKAVATSEGKSRTRVNESDYVHSKAALPDDATGGQLSLVLSLPRRQLLVGFKRQQALVSVVFVLICGLGVFLAVWQARALTRPLEEVIAAAKCVREGTWPQPLQVCGQGELGLLQEVFNDMTATLQANQLVTIQTLAAAVDARDAYTRGHSDRVALYAQRLARALELSEELVERIHTIGTLHDLGKIAIPDSILLKPGPLTPEERTIMESHPVRSEDILRNVPALAAILPGVRHHHERWDGRGYPDGLVGEAIPLEARILTLADTFDALTSDRPYRRGWSFERALAEIARCSGTQFDPTLVPSFLSLWASELPEAELRRAA